MRCVWLRNRCDKSHHGRWDASLWRRQLQPGPRSPRMNRIGHRSWSVQLQHNWPADDAWLRPGLEIAFAIPTSTDQRTVRSRVPIVSPFCPKATVIAVPQASDSDTRRRGTGSHCLKSEATFCCGSALNIRAKMDTTSSLLVQKTIVEEPERRDDYGLAKGGGKHLDEIPASRLAARLELLRNTLRSTPHVQLAIKRM